MELSVIKHSGGTLEQTGSFDGSIGWFRQQSVGLLTIEISVKKFLWRGATSNNFQEYSFQWNIFILDSVEIVQNGFPEFLQVLKMFLLNFETF